MIVPLAKIADIQTGPFGSQLHEKDYVEGEGTPIVTVEHLGERRFASNNLPLVGNIDYQRLAKYTMRPGDIIFSRVGSVERCSLALPENDGWLFSGRCLRVRPKKGVDSNYLYAYLSAPAIKKYIRSIAVGATMPSINTSIMGEIPIRVPTYEKQRSIGFLAVLFDKKIEVNQRINGYLEELLVARYDELFAADNREYDGTISDVGEVVGGATPSKKKAEYYTREGIGWITPRDLSNTTDKFISHGADDITQAGYNSCSARLMPAGTVLFSSRAPIGYIAIATDELATNQGFKSVVPKEDIGTAFVYCFLKRNKDRIADAGSGTTFPEVSGKTMKGIGLAVPDRSLCEKFSDWADPILRQQRLLEEENRRLGQLRDTILPKLMTGEIDLSSVK